MRDNSFNPNAPKQPRPSDLVTLGTAAVLTVYSAGYVRTSDAAQRIAVEAAQRRGAALAMKGPSERAIDPPREAVPEERTAPELPKLRRAEAHLEPTAVKAPEPPRAAPPPSQSAVAQAPDSESEPANKKERNRFKDGVYYGWGTSRHGDIQAMVEIKDGKIAGASISQCLTRYSCSWVSALPPEVVQRQSAEVDVVSGATESSNAFYYAIVEALKQAK